MSRGEREERQRKPQPFDFAGKGTRIFHNHQPLQLKPMSCDQPKGEKQMQRQQRDTFSHKDGLHLLLRELSQACRAVFVKLNHP